MPEPLRVYVNTKSGEVPAGATVLDAVRVVAADEADMVETGERLICDSRGLPIAPGTPAYQGLILRVIRNREQEAESEL